MLTTNIQILYHIVQVTTQMWYKVNCPLRNFFWRHSVYLLKAGIRLAMATEPSRKFRWRQAMCDLHLEILYQKVQVLWQKVRVCIVKKLLFFKSFALI